jgi:succinate-semialdehyde dehydrogenase / glutarate-semialdehyde dehydrogenase
MSIQSLNPATGELLATYLPIDETEIERRLERAVDAFRIWRGTPIAQRASLMIRAAELLEAGAQGFGRLMTLEMGKPLASAGDEALKSARGCRYYAENAARFLADEEVSTEAERTYIRYEPCGPVLAIMPWNFPFWQVLRFAAHGRQRRVAQTLS